LQAYNVRALTQNGTWLIPTLNGEPRLAKPPLPNWLTAFSVKGANKLYDLAALRFSSDFISALLVFFIPAYSPTHRLNQPKLAFKNRPIPVRSAASGTGVLCLLPKRR
jgi:hypothetical protein